MARRPMGVCLWSTVSLHHLWQVPSAWKLVSCRAQQIQTDSAVLEASSRFHSLPYQGSGMRESTAYKGFVPSR